MKKIGFIAIVAFFFVFSVEAQEKNNVRDIKLDIKDGINVTAVTFENGDVIDLPESVPLFSLKINDSLFYSTAAEAKKSRGKITFQIPTGIQGRFKKNLQFSPGLKAEFVFKNVTKDTIELSDVVPFGESSDRIYITASGPWSLARTKLFRPGLGPVGVVLPDNAWELGYGNIPLKKDQSICAITRRLKTEGGNSHRWKTILYPGTSVKYVMVTDGYRGVWQNGLRMMFQERYLYDLKKFDTSLYERKDLKWIRHQYVITTQMAWDHDFYDAKAGEYTFDQYLAMGEKYFDGWDVYILWPTWPTLGLDQRNQWDLYADLPGGLPKIRELADMARNRGTKFFISYNPWDKSTRRVSPYKGMKNLIKATDADGVILDTYGKSSQKLQAAADDVKSGVVMYSEGMAVPKDMPSIITGRVHDAIYMPPPINLNKFIKPNNAIFRVCQLYDGHMHRETSVSFFNGYGVEINIYRPGRPAWMHEEYLYLGRLAKILRENSSAFLSKDWTPLIPTRRDSIWVNKWPTNEKTIYTIFSLIPEGFHAPLFKADHQPASHYVSLFHHEEVALDTIDHELYLPAKTEAFHYEWLNTRKEGSVDCIAMFPKYLDVHLKMDTLYFKAKKGDQIRIWAGNPSYQNTSENFSIKEKRIKLLDYFGRYEGKFVIQLMDGKELIDERVVRLKMQTSRLISSAKRTLVASTTPTGMVKIEGTDEYIFKNKGAPGIIPYYDFPKGKKVAIQSFYMDKYPVTNVQYKAFLTKTNYTPKDTTNFLKHWKNGEIPKGKENHPVVYVSIEDARAFARWRGKRLPTEIEWQYAAQGTDGRKWPWGNEFDSTKCNVGLNHSTPVDAFPSGKSPFGVMDLIGNVWQLTNDRYDNSSYYFTIIKGGSYYHPTASWWYVQGGPQPISRSQMLLEVEQGFERNATVGFRCVKDMK